MIGTIEINDIEIHAYHGCFAEEKIIGTKFLVQLVVTANCETASDSDNIHDAVNYQTLYDIVIREMNITSNILEHVAKRILDSIYNVFNTSILTAQVTVSKCNPPLGGKVQKVSVTLSR